MAALDGVAAKKLITVYYFLVLLNAALFFGVAVITYLRNRQNRAGLYGSLALLVTSLWLVGFAQYYRPLPDDSALIWAKITLTFGVAATPLIIQLLFALTERQDRWRWVAIGACYLTSAMCVWLIWNDQLLTGLRSAPYLDHYVHYNRVWYPFLITHIAGWQWAGTGMLLYYVTRTVGYKRMQLIYYSVAWVVWLLAGNGIIVPIEYEVHIPPFGFLLMPLNTLLLGYVMTRARLADFNVVAARALLYLVMLLLVVAASLLFIGTISLLAPGFMNQRQVLFTVGLVMVIGLSLATVLPRFLPYAEHIVQERFFAGRFSYQDMLSGLIRELSNENTVETLLTRVVTTLQNQMQVSRALVFLQDPLLNEYRLRAQSGVPAEEQKKIANLATDNPVIQWLQTKQDSLVREEQMRTLTPLVWKKLSETLNQLHIVVCVPMLREGKLTGVLCLGEKTNHGIFFVSDLKLLTTLATDLALSVHYRRIEEHAVHQNKLITLGTLAAGIAHEVRNPLSSIRTFAQLLPTKGDDPDFTHEFSKIVIQDVDRITRVIQSMLSFARPSTVNIGNHTAADLIDEALVLAQSRLSSKHIQVTKALPTPVTLCVDKHQILQVLLNILNNAADALPENGVIRITTGTHPTEEQSALPSKNFGVIEIADNGPGIPAAVRSRLFDPFFTTKSEGTGLGLSISQKIARDHNGYITVSGSEGMGAAFQLHLPLD